MSFNFITFEFQSVAESVVSVIERQMPSRPSSAASSSKGSGMGGGAISQKSAAGPEINYEAGLGMNPLERKTFSSQPLLSGTIGRMQVRVISQKLIILHLSF